MFVCFFSILLFSNGANLCASKDKTLNSLKLTLNSLKRLSQTYFLKLSPLCLTTAGLGNWNDKFIIFVECNDKSLRIGMYWEFSICRNLCFLFLNVSLGIFCVKGRLQFFFLFLFFLLADFLFVDSNLLL